MDDSIEGARTVKPRSGAAPYYGGKRNLAGRIVPMIEAAPHVCYCEPFVGMGGIFFRRTAAPKSEVINDLNRDISTFFRVLQRHFVAFIDMMRWQVTTRAEFERLKACNPETLTDLERSARFYYLQRIAFGGRLINRSFSSTPEHPARFDITRLQPDLEDLHLRLAGVVIENLDYAELIRRYDRAGTLFYLDPPYVGREDQYAAPFEREDFGRMAEQLRALKGRFIMSIDDHPLVRELFAWATIEAVDVRYSFSNKLGSSHWPELIISSPAA